MQEDADGDAEGALPPPPPATHFRQTRNPPQVQPRIAPPMRGYETHKHKPPPSGSHSLASSSKHPSPVSSGRRWRPRRSWHCMRR
ncbi:unnamed protein product [Urochloa humidicola]